MRKPETHNAMLASAGHARLRVTRHVYAATRKAGGAYEYFFKCLTPEISWVELGNRSEQTSFDNAAA